MLILDDKTSLDVPKGLALGYVTGSLVYDSGIFGATSPILGQSYILQVQPNFGSINYGALMADFRKYIMPVRPFTLAFRALHYGRYGKGGEDGRLWPLYLGYWDLVRGYESFTQEEYASGGDFNMDRLYGSKMLLANFELRFPLLRVLGLGKGFYGAWPIEFYGFYDIGLAWWDNYNENNYYLSTPDDPRPSFLGGSRKPISSVGAGLRTNVFGFLIIGVHYVYPIDRPQRGWHFQLSISPGF
jgi:outer membrane protein assembly factor BamA